MYNEPRRASVSPSTTHQHSLKDRSFRDIPIHAIMSTTNSRNYSPAASRAASSSATAIKICSAIDPFRKRDSHGNFIKDEKMPVVVSAAFRRIETIADPRNQTNEDSAPSYVTPPHTLSPSPLIKDEGIEETPISSPARNPTLPDIESEDDDWQPQTHSRDEPALPTKRKHQATVETEEDVVPSIETPQSARVTKKANTTEGKAKSATDKGIPRVAKCYNVAKELDKKANAEQARLARAPNKHLAAMNKWDL